MNHALRQALRYGVRQVGQGERDGSIFVGIPHAPLARSTMKYENILFGGTPIIGVRTGRDAYAT